MIVPLSHQCLPTITDKLFYKQQYMENNFNSLKAVNKIEENSVKT